MKPYSTSDLPSISATPYVQQDPRLRCAAIGIATHDGPTRGLMVTWAGDLVAILGEVDRILSPDETWIVEFGVGPCEPPPGGLFFDTLDEAIQWAEVNCREELQIGHA
jgi:hypothetical protein